MMMYSLIGTCILSINFLLIIIVTRFFWVLKLYCIDKLVYDRLGLDLFSQVRFKNTSMKLVLCF